MRLCVPAGLCRRRPQVCRKRGGGRGGCHHCPGAGGGFWGPGDSCGGHPEGPGPDERRFLWQPGGGGHLCHRRDRNQGKDHHRLYDPLYFRGRRPQDRGHRHHRGAYGGGTDPDRQHHPHELRHPTVPAPHGGRRVRILCDGGLLHRPEGPAGLRLPLYSGGVHQLFGGPHRRGGAQGHAGIYGKQGKAVLPVQNRCAQCG